MDVIKSSRHSKITGDFAESLVLYWLSKYGFECAKVDHTGIDLIARNPHVDELMGISVKSRSRSTGKEGTSLRIDPSDIAKAGAACVAFDCVPYFAIVVDEASTITGYILPMEHMLELHPLRETSCSWPMSQKWMAAHAADPMIKRFSFDAMTHTWWEPSS